MRTDVASSKTRIDKEKQWVYLCGLYDEYTLRYFSCVRVSLEVRAS